MERLTLQPGAAASIDEYLEYKRIVGEDDGGKLFTPEEYEQYKKKILPIRLQNRLYVSWRSPTGMDCKLVGPETPCFCTHRYKQHKTDFEVIPKERPIPVPCKVSQCPCKCYNFVPLNGTQPIRCRCKHFADQHSAGPGFPCNTCSKCSGFHSCFTCGCGQPAYAHETVVETKEERLAQGKPVGQDVPFAAMGGLTGFSSLAEGYMRLDDSGIGGASTAMAMSSLRRPEEDDMAYFERQYQTRSKIGVGSTNMEEDSAYSQVEKVIGCHVEDAVTFWGQNINRHNDILKTGSALAEICPQASPVFGNPDLTKCQVLYIDYGNSEILCRSEIVEIPADLQFPSVAKRYKLWGLQIPADQELNQFDQGRKFLNSLIFEKEMRTRYKATSQDGTIAVQAECGLLDVGEEMCRKGFAERCKPSTNSNAHDTKIDSSAYQSWNAKALTPLWAMRGNTPASGRVKGSLGDHVPLNSRSENNTSCNVPFNNREKIGAYDFRRISNISLGKIKQDQKLIEENEKLKEEKEAVRKENQNLLHQCEELETKIEELTHSLEKEKKASKKYLEHLDSTLHTYIGTTVRSLATKFKKLKEARQDSMGVRFGEDLSEAVNIVTEGCLGAPPALEKLEKIWTDYNTSQEEIRLCKYVDKMQILIHCRNEVQQKLYSAVEEFIMEVDNLPLSERLERLQEFTLGMCANITQDALLFIDYQIDLSLCGLEESMVDTAKASSKLTPLAVEEVVVPTCLSEAMSTGTAKRGPALVYACVYPLREGSVCSIPMKLEGSLKAAYGLDFDTEGTEGAFERFFEWKNAKLQELSRVRKATDTSLQALVTSFSKMTRVKMTLCYLKQDTKVGQHPNHNVVQAADYIGGCNLIFFSVKAVLREVM
ncbi:hypothetical protein EYD10_15559 [Varanus komodoensis]|nr:hypothetical protein EYD10_15559 [Varanus komodoensis]